LVTITLKNPLKAVLFNIEVVILFKIETLKTAILNIKLVIPSLCDIL